MKVILLEDVMNLGYKDDIVTVADGYGRNYLIPKGVAVIATEKAQKILSENLRQRQHKLAAIKKEAEEKAEKMSNVKLHFKVRTSKLGGIYGSVSSLQIAEELEKIGYPVDRKTIYLKNPIKEVGEYTCQLCLHKEVQLEIPIVVESENASQTEKKQEGEKISEEPSASGEEVQENIPKETSVE